MKRLFIIIVLFFAGCAEKGKNEKMEEPVTSKIVDGELLFKNNCASCHKPEKDFVGPALKGSLERWDGDKKAMYDFIKNPSKSISENEYARKLVEKWQVGMTSFALSDAEIDAIMNYCENPIEIAPAVSQ